MNKTLISGFGIKIPDKLTVQKKLKKVKEETKITKRNTIKISLPLEEKLKIINEEVLKVLGKYRPNTFIIYKYSDLIDYINKCNDIGLISIDTETNNSLDPMTCKIMGLCLYAPGLTQVYVPINHTTAEDELLYNAVSKIDEDGEEYLIKTPKQLTEEQVKECLSMLKDNTKIIMHNAKFDIQVIDYTCFKKVNSLKCYWDTMLAAKILDENVSSKLKDLYCRYIDSNSSVYSIETFFKGVNYNYVDPEIFALYASTDSYITYKLYEYQVNWFKELNDPGLFNVFMNIEMQVLPQLLEMQDQGLALDFKYIENLKSSYHKKLEEAETQLTNVLIQYNDKIEEYKKNNPNHKLDSPIKITSSSQLAVFLYDILKLKSPDKEHPRGTGEEILVQLDHPFIKPLLDFRAFFKLVSTYIDKMPLSVNPNTKKIHAKFNQIGAEERTVVTGRFSSSDPMEYIMNWGQKIRLIQRRAIA